MDSSLEYEIVRVKSKERMRRNALGPDELLCFQGNNDDDTEKENSGPCLRDKTKNRLQRLGVLYGDGEMSSPIHRSEEVYDDDEEQQEACKDKYSEERSRRFRALASTINSWEDDVRHISPKKEEVERYDRFGNRIGSKAVKHDLVRPVGVKSAVTSPSPKKKVAWDKKIINTLESQGFKRCDSQEHLVYDYVSPENRECTSPRKTPMGTKRNATTVQSNTPKKSAFVLNRQQTFTITPKEQQPKKIFGNSLSTPFRKVVEVSSTAPNERGRSVSPLKDISPRKSPSPQRKLPSPQKSAVLEMAAQFEGNTQPTRNLRIEKDPALMSVSEKRAVFEKNRGFIPIPQQAAAGPSAQNQRVRSPVRQPFIMPGRSEISKSPERRQMTTPGSDSGNTPIRHNVNQAVLDRFKEIEALRHRWDRNKAISSVNEGLKAEQRETSPSRDDFGERMDVVETPTTTTARSADPPLPPPLPGYLLSPPSTDSTPASGVPRPAFTPSPSRPSVEPTSPQRIRMGTRSPVKATESPPRQERRLPPRVLSIKEKSPKRDHRYPEIKKIKVSPPKRGHIYPSISDIETESEVPESDLDPIEEEGSESEEVRDNTSCGFSSELDSSIGSLGKQIVRQASKSNLKRRSNGLDASVLRSSSSSSWSYSESESRVLREMDDLLDEAMGEAMGPSPPSPKRLREVGGFDTDSSSSATQDEMARRAVTTKALVHTVSDYRKQQGISTTPKVRREVRNADDFVKPFSQGIIADSTPEEELVLDRIKELQTEISKQLETISQASKALNLCHSTPGFSGSSAEVEAQRLLLISRSRWTAMTEEVDRLKVEKKLKPGMPGRLEQGHITLSNITLPVKSFQSGGSNASNNASVIVIIKSGATLLHTETLSLDKKTMRDGRLSFQKVLTLKGLYGDFTASIEVYGYTPKKVEFSGLDGKSHTPNKKEKHKKQKDRCGFLPVESPAGPNVVRSSAFQLWGYAVFSLREVNRHSFTLSKVPYMCPLEGSLELSLASSMQSQVEHAGFLTVYEDVSGFGAWKRRWAVLRGSSVAFWAYPDQYKEGKVAMDTIDLSCVTSDEATLAPRDLCARPHTILLQSRIRDTTIIESLVARRDGDSTILTFLLSADTKEERLQWCQQINQVLHLLKAWKVTRI